MFTQVVKNAFEPNVPIFSEEILGLFPNYTRAYTFRLLKKSIEEGLITRFSQGVYYIPQKTIYGNSSITPDMIAEKKYIQSNNQVYGVYSGLSLLHFFHITSQVPNTITIVTNNEATNKRIVDINNRVYILKKSRCEISSHNYAAYTILQLLTDMEPTDQFNETSKNAVINYIQQTNIALNDLLDLLCFFPSKTSKRLFRSGLLNVFISKPSEI